MFFSGTEYGPYRYVLQGLTLRPARLPRASKSVMGASKNFILLAPKSINFNTKSMKFNFFICICGEKINFVLIIQIFLISGKCPKTLMSSPVLWWVTLTISFVTLTHFQVSSFHT